MKSLIFISGFLLCAFYPQDDMKKKAFYALVNSLISHSVDEVKAEEVTANNQVWLDARARAEYDVSHVENAQFVGYDNFDLSTVDGIDKDAEIIVYCSIGYRSEKVAEKLEKAGFTHVKNLYGGLFDWVNQGKEVVDSTGQATQQIHGYNVLWGQWVSKGVVVYE